MAGQTVIAGIVCLFVLTLASEKRILLNDPAYVSQQLTHLQSELQELRVKAGNQEQTVTTLQQTVSDLQQTVTNQQSVIMKMAQESGKGVVYSRWGRKDCPAGNDTQLVYSGFAGVSHYTSPGGAADTLCMPPEPVWGPGKTKLHVSKHMSMARNMKIQACLVCQT
ncbi:uncharacterized protein LOC110453349 isoform X2 [Mizuhopecten yessoensis]|uniref:Uncharacterized protein n=1 Tax=Mizuhopecten yessoensis TaxID=6573 RepID=A0A210QHM5_MIZYE|nr:uncharacterized protein LOC110453349 isoform X2 [Mizuhopecten yessoensis]OWF48209.1 hypothetical protein KP79_PYT14488 [Mizuhopecten yessoensis]